MNKIEKLYTIPRFAGVLSKLYKDGDLSKDDKEYLLACALLLFTEYDRCKERIIFEHAYNIILRYSICTGDYQPLYDVSCNYGFYPTVKYINEKGLLNKISINNALLGYKVERYKNDGYIETYEQNKTRQSILKSEKQNIAFIAPTSSGKSSLIIQHLNLNEHIKRAVVLVPTKSLIAQSYIDLRLGISNRKFVCHEGMYAGENAFIGVLTQERLLRLLEKYEDLTMDCVYVDEAHNIFKNDDRNVLLARSLKICKDRNKEVQIIYLSPFINDVSNLIMGDINEIDEQRISYNIKEPNIFIKDRDNAIEIFDRFSSGFYDLGKASGAFEYIKQYGKRKNFIFLNSPAKIEAFAEKLYSETGEITPDDKILELQKLLRDNVHPDFKIIKYLEHGIIYLHAKIPDHIKEYLEYQFKTNPAIKYLIANVVIMEGINLPIDNLFVCNVYHMKPAALQNLLGRVNRLNTIFDPENGDIRRLMPSIHFVDVPNFTGKNCNMQNVVKKIFLVQKDEVHNPLLANYNIDDLKGDKKKRENEKNNRTIENEKIYFSTENINSTESLRKKLVVGGMSQLVDVSIENSQVINRNIENCVFNREVIDIVSDVFTKNVKVLDAEFRRLKYPSAIRYYKFLMRELKKGDFAGLISSQLEYQLARAEKDNDPYMYVGKSYGEEKGRNIDISQGQNVFVNIRKKTRAQLINLLIVKTKIEQEFLSFQYNRAVIFLHDNGYIDDKTYNMEIYGTNDKSKIEILNLGISRSLLNLLEKNDQLKNISFDACGNLKGNKTLNEFKKNQNGFIKYEIDKYILFE